MTSPSPPEAKFAINPAIDVARLRGQFAELGRVRIFDFLAPGSAEALLKELRNSADWRHVIKGGETAFESTREAIAAMPQAERQALEQAIFREAAQGFQYRYDTIRVPDGAAERAAEPGLLNRFAEFMAGEEALAFFASVTGTEPSFADAQATRYCRGDFLTAHDDAVTGKQRQSAYVLGLTHSWRPEWGGLLLFTGGENGVDDALAPAFNCLDLFAVGQTHSVSFVAPYADADRISVTGWLRRPA